MRGEIPFKMAACMRNLCRTSKQSYTVLFGSSVSSKRCLKTGDRLPNLKLYTGIPVKTVLPQDLFKGKTGVLFSVLGAFTPGCTQAHIPEYLDHHEKFKDEGIDLVACVSVNDPFVMAAWGKDVKAEGKIMMLADPKAEFAKAMHMELDCKEMMGGIRSKRYSVIVEDGIVKHINMDPDHTGLSCLLCVQNMNKMVNKFSR